MDEEQINELSQLAEEIANESFGNIETHNDTPEEAIEGEIRVDAPEVYIDSIIDGTSHDSVNDVESVELTEPESERDFITPNIHSSVVEETTARFSSAEWFEKMQQQDIIIAGLGGIGRFGNLVYFW